MAITVPRERRTFGAAPVPVARGMPSRCGAATRVAGGDVVVTDLNMPEQCGLWLWRQTMIVRPELRGRFVLIASDPLPDPRAMGLLESERVLLKPLSLDTLWRLVDDAMQGTPLVAKATRAATQGRPAGRVGGAP